MDFPRAMREVLNGRILKHVVDEDGEQIPIFYKLDKVTGDLLQAFYDLNSGWETTDILKDDLEATDYEIVEIDEDSL